MLTCGRVWTCVGSRCPTCWETWENTEAACPWSPRSCFPEPGENAGQKHKTQTRSLDKPRYDNSLTLGKFRFVNSSESSGDLSRQLRV